MFTVQQYDQAIKALQDARAQILDGSENKGCGICGDGCNPHQCRFNPLYAMAMCEQISKESNELHETLHRLSGFDTYMGQQLGPAGVVVPPEKQPEFG